MEPEFHKAAMQGNIDVFKGKGKKIKSILTPNKNTILHLHFTNYTNNVSETFVKEVLRECPTLVLKANVKDETILHVAARYGHHQIVKTLVDFAKALPKDMDEVGAEKRLIRAVNDKKDTALHEAARYGHVEVVDVMINEELDHSHFGKNVGDETPLYIAVERRYWNVVDTILDKSNSPQYDGPNGRTALHAAILHGSKEVVSKLLAKNSSVVKEADENGWVPLHLAALYATSDMIRVLLENDRSTAYMRDKKGRTALHFAALHEDSSVMRKLLEFCPDCCELVDEKGSNALHYTAMREDNYLSGGLEQIMQNAPQMSNLYNEKNDDGNTPLHLLGRHAPKWKKDANRYNHPFLEPLPRVDKMAFNKYNQTALDIAIDAVPPHLASKNTMLMKLIIIGVKSGRRLLDRHLREKKHDFVVGEEKKQYKENNSEDDSAEMARNYSVVATLIAAVTFAAGFTVPGGEIQDGEDKGSPILKANAAFIVFFIANSLSFFCSTVAVGALFSLPLVKYSKSMLLQCCEILIWMALFFMMVAFITGTYSMTGPSLLAAIYISIMAVGAVIVCCALCRIGRFEVRSQNSWYNRLYFVPDCRFERAKEVQLSHTL
ncbi:ankyrin repeat-containing protein ITN1-like isoform X2 [Neltuma alba]|uniref:ankyrin repeat-containing protein ITN1-like isoform X2 n=1 Tax=Neltuma alba TaxID=207710 RepID=UPI0010A422D9|nr:ankyrin repeat-containing protein ITN1-like isoform X2 [Prosopis alba]